MALIVDTLKYLDWDIYVYAIEETFQWTVPKQSFFFLKIHTASDFVCH